LSTALLSPAAFAADQRLEAMLPEDASFVVLIEDLPGFLESWPESPLGQMWNDPQVKKFFAPVRESLAIDAWEERVKGEVGYSLSEVLESFDGQASLIAPDFRSILEAEKTGATPPFAVMARVDEDSHEIIEALMTYDLEHERSKADEGTEIEDVTEEFQGETIHVRRVTTETGVDESFGWAIVKDWVIAAEPRSYLQDLTAMLKKGSNGSALDDSAAFRKMRERTPESDLLLYVDIESIAPMLREEMEKNEAAADPEAPENPMGITPDGLMKALDLENLQALYFASTVGKQATEVDAGLLYRENKGLVKLLAYTPGPVELQGILPDDVISAGAANFSFPDMWDSLQEMLTQMSPMMGMMLQMQTPTPDGGDAINPLQAFFSSLGDKMITAEFLPEPSAPGEEPSLEAVETVVGISIHDRQTLEMAIDGFMTLLGGAELFDSHEYLGHEVHVLKSELQAEGEEGEGMAYALTDDYLLLGIGSSGPVESLLARIEKPRRSIWQRNDVKAAIAALPGKPSALAYYDVAAFVKQMFSAMVTMQSVSDAQETFCNPGAAPDPRDIAKYFGVAVGAYYKESGAFHSTFRLRHPE
jgi:hypothetical protein